ncbi:DUF3822 family protein [Ferruginibacter sp. SUN106]|uniref:DUF3822 family protein n=1 Tax=Ferruginibacter sp. SUN106 TaxID=2978348 RepID=UPI003D36D061
MPAENHTVNPSFNIKSTAIPAGKPVLLVQAGKQGISFAQLDSDSNTFTSVQVYHFAKQLSDAAIAEEINNLLSVEELHQQHFKKIFVTWCFDENILVPFEYFDQGHTSDMLQLVYGDAAQAAIQHELVLAHNLHTVYRIPVVIKNVFTHWLPFSIQNHQSSLLINIEKVHTNLLYCNFYPTSLTVMLRKNSHLQVIQNFEFNAPEDVAYHLLNVCRSFETAIQTTVLLSGMIDADSNLYNELHKYFLNIEFATLPGNFNYADEIQEQPAHYFSHLFATALCVL